ncbi:FkbM family methyltransferase [Halobellus inordinatus]|uniref:FkbM family methyltransferase n=1 Tax=Halobellus inordinatus TaxID=1126236 RepID=UPI0021141784|nr:FkbM family methyltransferase [Halobellus ramosii]
MSLRRKLIRVKGKVERGVDRARYQLSSDTHTVNVHGVTATFSVGSFADYRRARHLSNEHDQLSFLISEIQDGDVFWDVGSCTGTYACTVGQAAAQTVAFEPHPGNADTLRENIERNGLDDQVTVVEAALSDETGVQTFHVIPTESSGGHHSLVNRDLDETIEVNAIRTDDKDEYPVPDVVKMDVEGSEAAAIEGASETLSSHTRLILVESHPEADEVQVESLLSNLGFETNRKWGGEEHDFIVGRSK